MCTSTYIIYYIINYINVNYLVFFFSLWQSLLDENWTDFRLIFCFCYNCICARTIYAQMIFISTSIPLKELLRHIHSRAVHHAKRIAHYSRGLVHQRRQHFLTMTHIFLLLGLFMFYHISGLMFADEEISITPVETVIEADALVAEPSLPEPLAEPSS